MHYVWVGRIAALGIVLIGVGFAFWFKKVPDGLMMFFKLQGLMGAAFWLGLFWRRTTVAGAWAATIAAFVVLVASSTGMFNSWAGGQSYTLRSEVMSVASNKSHKTFDAIKAALDEVESTPAQVAERFEVSLDELVLWNGWDADALDPNRALGSDERLTVSQPALPTMMIWDGKFRDSWQIFSYLVAGFSIGIIVSLFTKRVEESRLDKVYRALRTPVDAEETEHLGPFELPRGMESPEPRKLINHPDFEIPMPTAVGLGGFTVLWACVGLLIGFVFWMATWGA